MAKDKSKTGRTPQNDAADRDRPGKSDPGASPTPAGSGGMKHKGDVDRDPEDRFTNDDDIGTPPGGSRGGQMSSPDRMSQRIDDDEEEDDMDFRPSPPRGPSRNR